MLRCSAYLLYLELSWRHPFCFLSLFQNETPKMAKGTLFFKNFIIMQYGSHKTGMPLLSDIIDPISLQCIKHDLPCWSLRSQALITWQQVLKTVFYCLSSMLFTFGLCIQGNHQLLTCVYLQEKEQKVMVDHLQSGGMPMASLHKPVTLTEDACKSYS